MPFLGLFFMMFALLITLATSSPLPELSIATSGVKRSLVPTVSITFNYAFSAYSYDIPNAQCQAPPAQFGDITGIDFGAKYQFCWFYKTADGCLNIETPILVGPKDDIHAKINFVPKVMFCYDPTFKCRGGGECH
ncbi:hypothetical protein EG328_005264 [Venturia inaequalis]|uniref:Uncharacterized protein n=1 Tax=Venturia inaequalis TaxID=5025 RepID=A0A8H3YW64_VENIN|nr:hypothetical protein EG328_005264 [Venturia inaequalis]